MTGDMSSLWFSDGDSSIRSGYDQYSYVSCDAKALIGAKEGYEMMKRASFDLLDILKHDFRLPGTEYDLAVVKVPEMSEEIVTKLARTARTGLSDGAFIVLLEQRVEPLTPVSEGSSDSNAVMVDESCINRKDERRFSNCVFHLEQWVRQYTSTPSELGGSRIHCKSYGDIGR